MFHRIELMMWARFLTLEVVRTLGIRGTGGFKIQTLRSRDLAQDVASLELRRGRSGKDLVLS